MLISVRDKLLKEVEELKKKLAENKPKSEKPKKKKK